MTILLRLQMALDVETHYSEKCHWIAQSSLRTNTSNDYFLKFSAARLVIIWISSRYYFSKSTTYSNSTLLSSTFCGECEIVLYPWYFCPKIATPYWKLSSLGISPMVTVFKERSTFSRLQNQWQASIPRQLSMRNF